MAAEEKEAREDRIRTLQLALEEQRRDYDVIDGAYQQAKLKNITFLAASLALLGYLYATTEDGSLKNKLFIPDEPYGVIIYAISLFLFLSAVAMLLFAVRPSKWTTAYDNDQEDCVSQDYEKYLIYMKKRYLRASKINTGSYARKQLMLDMSFLPMVAGGILLLLLKTFGG